MTCWVETGRQSIESRPPASEHCGLRDGNGGSNSTLGLLALTSRSGGGGSLANRAGVPYEGAGFTCETKSIPNQWGGNPTTEHRCACLPLNASFVSSSATDSWAVLKAVASRRVAPSVGYWIDGGDRVTCTVACA